jgi:biopolymer transport protein ExbB
VLDSFSSLISKQTGMHILGFFLFQNADADGEAKQNLLDLIAQGGPLGIGIAGILGLLSIVGVAIFIERWATINKAGKVDQQFMNNIRAAVAAGNIEGAKSLCQQSNSPVSRMVLKGIQRIGKPLKDIDAAIENVGNLEIFKLEKNLSTLASISGAAPMIGFFGTVVGMIQSFYKMASEQNVTPDVLAGGIYTALITTDIGIAIGIFSFVGYNLLVSRVDKVVFQMEQSTVEFMDLLQEPS